jgi:hypothetical protein
LSEEPVSGCKAGRAGLRVAPSALPGPLGSVAGVGDELAVDGVAGLALQGARCFLAGLAFGELAPVVDASVGVVGDLGDGGDVDGPVELAVPAWVESVPVLEALDAAMGAVAL